MRRVATHPLLGTLLSLFSVLVPFTTTAAQDCPAPEVFLEGGGVFPGRGVALDGSRALTGTPGDTSAWMGRRQGGAWIFDQLLVSAGAEPDDDLGLEVALDGDLAVIGAPGDDTDGVTNSGAAYVFRFDGIQWNQEQKLLPDIEVDDGQFGLSVAVQGSRILVGCPGDEFFFLAEGSVFVFEYDGAAWQAVQKLNLPLGSDYEFFGWDVDLDGDVLAAGGWGNDERGNDSGAVWVYRHDGNLYQFEQKLLAPLQDRLDHFGYSVAVDASRVLVGARTAGLDSLVRGAAHLFEFDGATWNHDHTFLAPQPSGSHFGIAVDLAGPLALIGASRESVVAFRDGAAHVFRDDGSQWNAVHRLLGSSPVDNNRFGAAVSLDGDRALVGSRQTHASLFDVRELLFHSDHDTIGTGDPVSLTTCGATPFTPTVMQLVAIDGTPLVQRILPGQTDATGHWFVNGILPPGPRGFTMTLAVMGVNGSGEIAVSNRVTIDVP